MYLLVYLSCSHGQEVLGFTTATVLGLVVMGVYLDVFSVVGVHELDAPNPLLLALVGVGHKSACLQGATVNSDKRQSPLRVYTCL